MDRKQLVLLVSTVASLLVCISATACNISPRLWCESEQTAMECGVYEQCKKYEWSPHQEASPVEFALYYESLCEGCRDFLTTMLYPTYQKISSIVDITLVPYGNGDEEKVGDHWKFTCQHGPDECLGNIIETCTIAIMKKTEDYLPFINCIEGSTLPLKDAATQCAPKFSLPLDQILNCTTSDYGNKLQHEMAVKTESLNPPHEYVPWVTVNGIHTEDIQNRAMNNLLKLICETYQGEKPPACKSV